MPLSGKDFPVHHLFSELEFLSDFSKEINKSLNLQEVVYSAAGNLFKYFHYKLAIVSVRKDSSSKTAFAPFAHGLAVPVKGFSSLRAVVMNAQSAEKTVSHVDHPVLVEIHCEEIKIELYCCESAAEKAGHELLSKIADRVSCALKNAFEHERVKELSVRDGLTGLYNRRVLEEMLSVEESRRNPSPMAVLLVDVDNFKSVNDTFGHPAGDRVLSVMGNLLRDNCRKENIVARYGGEEFAVLMTNPGLTADAAIQAAERLRKALGAQDFAFSRQKVKLTVSIGVAFETCREEGAGRLIELADQALYRAKHSGKNKVCFHGKEKERDEEIKRHPSAFA